MIRKILIFTILTVAAAAIVSPLWKSDAAQQQTSDAAQQRVSIGVPKGSAGRALPNFDIRLIGRGEFNEMDLSSTSGKQAAMQNARTRSRASAVEQFRSPLTAEKAANLRALVNEAGAMKNFFIDGGTLSDPQSDTADNIARKFLERHSSLFALSGASIEELKLENEDNDKEATFLNYTQTVSGLKVFEGQVQAVVSKNGEVLNVREGFLVDGPPLHRKAAMSEPKAIAKAFEHAGRTVFPSFVENYSRASTTEMSRFANPLDLNLEEVLSEQNVVRVAGESRLAWHVFVEVGPQEWYEILLDAYTGELLLRHNLYLFEAQGTVYTEAPDKGARQLVSFVGDTTINTAAGWMGTSTVTTGNNVEAYLDTNADNAPDTNNGAGLATGHASAANQDFTFPFSTTVDPRTQQAAVVTNLFYYNNIMHDFSYNLGFTETARNFQVNNFGRGGTGNDSVRAEAQDGSGTNNANFATPPDGSRPRMQQFLFTSPTPDRDSSIDGDVVFHEYGHGISNRLIGNGSTALSGTQSGAMGEGWSDYWAITINNDGAVGEYVTNNPAGIRRAAYSVPAAAVHDSYADVGAGGFEVHRDGEVWAATLWDLRTQLGAATTDRIVLNGMKFTPTRPSFLNARDGILQADQNLNGGANRCAIWTVFARHGMGVSAVGNDGTTHTAATDVPADCGGTCSFSINPTSASFAAAGGSGSVTVTTTTGCDWTAVSNNSFITITSGASGSGSGTVNYSVAANTSSLARSGSMTIAGLMFNVSQAGTGGGCANTIVNPGFETGMAPWTFSGQVTRSTGTFPHSGTAYAILTGVNSSTGTLFQTVTVPSNGCSNLQFWLNITTDEAAGAAVFDRLFIEVRSTSGTLLATLATFSNQNSGTAGVYVLRGPFNLSSFAGQTVRIQFRGTNDITLPTIFRVDDVSLQ
jgi:Zn-dependent metalloprotease